MADLTRFEMGDPALIYERNEARAIRQAQKAIRKAAQNPFEDTMTDDQSADIDHLIQEWHAYARLYRPALGVPTCSVYAKDYRTSETKRYGNDAADDSDLALMAIKAEAFEACFNELALLHRLAIQNHLRNLDAGASVIRNPRLGTPAQAAMLYVEAKEALLPRLRNKELVR